MNCATTKQCLNVDCQHIYCRECHTERHRVEGKTRNTLSWGVLRGSQEEDTENESKKTRRRKREQQERERHLVRGTEGRLNKGQQLEKTWPTATTETSAGLAVQAVGPPIECGNTTTPQSQVGGQQRQQEGQTADGSLNTDGPPEDDKRTPRKRKQPEGDGPAPLTDPAVTPENTPTPAKWACPFFKLNPARWARCRSGHADVRYVKQHLRRTLNHKIPDNACPKCKAEFPGDGALSDHTTQNGCGAVEYQGVSEETLEAWSDKNKSPEEQWYSLWDRIFPGVHQPSSPYVTGNETDEYVQWGARNRPPFMRQWLADHGVNLGEADQERLLDVISHGEAALFSRYREGAREAPGVVRPTEPAAPPPPFSVPTPVALASTSAAGTRNALTPRPIAYPPTPASTVATPSAERRDAPTPDPRRCTFGDATAPARGSLTQEALGTADTHEQTHDDNPGTPRVPASVRYESISQPAARSALDASNCWVETGSVSFGQTAGEMDQAATSEPGEPPRGALRLRPFTLPELEEWAEGPGLLMPVNLPSVPWDRVLLVGRHPATSISREVLRDVEGQKRQPKLKTSRTPGSASGVPGSLPELEEWNPNPSRLESITLVDLLLWDLDPEPVSLPTFPWHTVILEGRQRGYSISRANLQETARLRQMYDMFDESRTTVPGSDMAQLSADADWSGVEGCASMTGHVQETGGDMHPLFGEPTVSPRDPKT